MTIPKDTCSSCGVEILWYPHEKTTRPAPIVSKPDPKGNVLLLARDATGELFPVPHPELGAIAYRVLGKHDLAKYREKPDAERAELPVRISHFANCKDALHWADREKKEPARG